MSNRVTFVISSLNAGGAERVMSRMANYWAAQGAEITLITLSNGEQSPFYKLDPAVRLIPLGISKESSTAFDAIFSNIKRLSSLRRTIRETHASAVISFIAATNVLVSLATIGLKIRVILSERNEPSMQNIGKTWDFLRRISYPFANSIVVVNEYARNYFPQRIRKKTVMIPNPVMPPAEVTSEDIILAEPSIVAMGSFDHQKGFDMLLQAFAKISERFPDWSLTILGDGKLRPALESLRDELGLNSKVYMPGIVNNPYDYLSRTDIFVLSSRYEGFPNALCEAMASGAAVISFDCKTGPAQIINDGVDGILVPHEDVDALAAAMTNIMGDEIKRNSLKAAAPEIINKFSIDKVMNMWADVISKSGKS